MKKFSLSMLAVAVAAFSFAQNNGKIQLVKGQKYAVENKLNTVINQEFMGQAMEITIDVTSNSAIEVKDLQEKNYNISNTITRLNMAGSVMGQNMSYDSDKKEDRDGQTGKALSGFINKPMDVKVNENGKVVAGAKVEKAAEGEVDPMAAMIGGVNDPKQFVETAFIVVPAGSKAGFTWIDSSTTDMGKKSTTYTVREIKGNDAVLDIKGTMQNNTKQQMQGNEITTNTTGTIAGESIVDMSTGVVKNHSITVNATGTSEVMGQQIPLTTKVISKTTITPAQ